MKTKSFFLIILVLTVFISCNQNTPPEDLPIYENNGEEDIFAGGYSIPIIFSSEPGYWLNNQWSALENPADKTIFFNEKPMLYNNNVYIFGNIVDKNKNKEYGYWKNGKWLSPDFLKTNTPTYMNIDYNGNLCFCISDSDKHLGYILFNEQTGTYTTTLLKTLIEAKSAQITSKPVFDTNGNVYIGGCYKTIIHMFNHVILKMRK